MTGLVPSVFPTFPTATDRRSLTLHVERLDTIAGPLTVTAERITGDHNTVLYSFAVHAGAQSLLDGRAVVVLDAAGITPGTNARRDPA